MRAASATAPARARRAVILSVSLLAGCTGTDPANSARGSSESDGGTIEQLRVEVLAEYPHDRSWYTQGLLLRGSEVYESHGGYGQSGLVRYTLGEPTPSRAVRLDDDLFAEGLELVDDRLVQLTWRSGRVLVWDVDSFELLGEHRLVGEGWGLAFDGTLLWVSNGTHLLTGHDPITFERRRRVAVYRGKTPQTQLNELEWARGSLFANVYETDEIVRIQLEAQAPEEGTERANVTAVIDASGLLSAETAPGAEVLNGIAYSAERGTFLLTGKYWPSLFEVRWVSP